MKTRTHDRSRQLAEAAEVLGTLVRNILLKRALHAADPSPRLNFWCIQYGNLMDLAVIDWCKLFGSDDAEHQPIHWKNIADDQDSFRSALLEALEITHEDWETYWRDMKKYRDFNAAHHDPRRAEIPAYPELDKALDSAFFYCEYIQHELRKLGQELLPTDIRSYARDFEAKCLIHRHNLCREPQRNENPDAFRPADRHAGRRRRNPRASSGRRGLHIGRSRLARGNRAMAGSDHHSAARGARRS